MITNDEDLLQVDGPEKKCSQLLERGDFTAALEVVMVKELEFKYKKACYRQLIVYCLENNNPTKALEIANLSKDCDYIINTNEDFYFRIPTSKCHEQVVTYYLTQKDLEAALKVIQALDPEYRGVCWEKLVSYYLENNNLECALKTKVLIGTDGGYALNLCNELLFRYYLKHDQLANALVMLDSEGVVNGKQCLAELFEYYLTHNHIYHAEMTFLIMLEAYDKNQFDKEFEKLLVWYTKNDETSLIIKAFSESKRTVSKPLFFSQTFESVLHYRRTRTEKKSFLIPITGLNSRTIRKKNALFDILQLYQSFQYRYYDESQAVLEIKVIDSNVEIKIKRKIKKKIETADPVISGVMAPPPPVFAGGLRRGMCCNLRLH